MKVPLFLTGIFTGVFGFLCLWSWVRQRTRLRRHAGLSRVGFVEHCERAGLSPDVAAAVYECFQPRFILKEYEIAPSDQIDDVPTIGDGYDLDEALEEVYRKVGCELPSSRILKRWETPVETLEDLVRWVDWIGAQYPNNPDAL
jgi:hypothetical protein